MADALPPQQQQALRQAQRLEWITLVARASVLVALGLAAESQAVRALWLKNVLACGPPIAFLVATRLEQRRFDPRFPFGLYRVNMAAHLINALLLLAIGGYLLFSAGRHLHQGAAPELGWMHWGDTPIWSGWLMMTALAYSGVVPMLLGHPRRRLALRLHDKALLADSAVGRAEWQCAIAAIAGLLGVHAGLWWADYVAAGLIALLILRYGARNFSEALRGLIDEKPRRLDGRFDPLPDRITELLNNLDWVASADVRMREEGRLLSGRARVRVTAQAQPPTPEMLQQTLDSIHALDWRLHDFALTPVPDPPASRD